MTLTAAALLSLLPIFFPRRWMLVLLWTLLVVIQLQNPAAVGGGDRFLLVLIFWWICLPYPLNDLPPTVSGDWSLAWRLQWFVLYESAFYFKAIHPDWWSGKILSQILVYSPHAIGSKQMSDWILGSPHLVQVGSWLVLGVEFIAPWFFLLGGSLRSNRTKRNFGRISLTSLVALHVVCLPFLSLSMFPWLAIAGLLSFVRCPEIPADSQGEREGFWRSLLMVVVTALSWWPARWMPALLIPVKGIPSALMLDQKWQLYSKGSEWRVKFDVISPDGEKLWTWDKHRELVFRHRKMLANAMSPAGAPLRGRLAGAYCVPRHTPDVRVTVHQTVHQTVQWTAVDLLGSQSSGVWNCPP